MHHAFYKFSTKQRSKLGWGGAIIQRATHAIGGGVVIIQRVTCAITFVHEGIKFQRINNKGTRESIISKACLPLYFS
jgi:hypothetical protein